MSDTFKDIIEIKLAQLLNVYERKADEYAFGNDEFNNIRLLAELNGMEPNEMCLLLSSKHFLSLLHSINSFSTPLRREKINDIHLYLEIADYLSSVHDD